MWPVITYYQWPTMWISHYHRSYMGCIYLVCVYFVKVIWSVLKLLKVGTLILTFGEAIKPVKSYVLWWRLCPTVVRVSLGYMIRLRPCVHVFVHVYTLSPVYHNIILYILLIQSSHNMSTLATIDQCPYDVKYLIPMTHHVN